MSVEAKFTRITTETGSASELRLYEVFAREMLAPGQRYSLVAEHLSGDDGTGGCLAEIGCGGGEALLILFGISSLRPDHWRGHRFGPVVPAAGRSGGYEFLSYLNEKRPFADNEVDYLIAMRVIEHLFDPFHAFRKIKRCLSYRGTAYVSLPIIKNRIRLLVGWLPQRVSDTNRGSRGVIGMGTICIIFPYPPSLRQKSRCVSA
jgi:hypothetical protein